MTITELAYPAALVASDSTEGGVAVITLRGEADLFTLPVVVDVLARVIASSDGPVVVDLRHTEFVDTGAVCAIVRASQFLDARNRTLTLRSPSKLATRVLVLLGVAHLIEPDGLTAP